MDVCCLSEGRKDPQKQFRDDPREHRPGVGGEGRARLSLPLDQRTGPLHPAESQLEPIPQGVSLWMGPHLGPCTAMRVVLPPWYIWMAEH